MRKKYHTLEEVRAANREAARKWREGHKVLARERVAANYGRAKYPGMVEAAKRKEKDEKVERRTDGDGATVKRDRQEDSEGSGVSKPEEMVSGDGGRAGDIKGSGGTVRRGTADGELRYEDIEGWDTPDAEQRARAEAFRRRRGGRVMGPKQEGGQPLETAETRRVEEELARLVAKRKERPGVAIKLKLD